MTTNSGFAEQVDVTVRSGHTRIPTGVLDVMKEEENE